MSLQTLERALGEGLPCLFSTTPRERGDIRVSTPFLLPDCDYFSLFVFERDGRLVISDYATAFLWIKMETGVSPVPDLVRAHMADIAYAQRVDINGVELEITVDDQSELAESVLRLSAAVVRVAELFRLIRPENVEGLDRTRATGEREAVATQPLVHSAD